MSRKWPFGGDSPVAKARKIALAYRALAQEQHARAMALVDSFAALTKEDWMHVLGDEKEADDMMQAFRPRTTDPVNELDRRFRQWGETWHADIDITPGPDEWVTSTIAGQLIQMSSGAVNRNRQRGRIAGRHVKTDGGTPRWYYQVRDVYALSAELRKRRSRSTQATDTVSDSGRSDPE